jgi:hypothetical protein
MTPDMNPRNPSSSGDTPAPDSTVYQEILRKLADVLRSTDFTTYLGGITFVMELADATYEPGSNVRSIERSNDAVTALAFLFLLLLEQVGDQNEMAKMLADEVERQAQEYEESVQPNLIPQEEFSEMLASNPHYTMSLEEFFEIMDLPSEEMFSLMNDMIKLNTADDVESLFTDGPEAE